MTVRILLLRHGQTDWNKEFRYQGRTDIRLNRAGLNQARRAARALADSGIGLVVASPLKRAAETGRIIAEYLHVPLRLDRDLMEISHGRWEGETRETVGEKYLEIIDAWKDDPYGRSAPDGETVGRVRDRALRAVKRIRSGNDGGTTLVVAHDGLLRALRIGLAGLGFERYLQFGLESGRTIELTGTDGRLRETGGKRLW